MSAQGTINIVDDDEMSSEGSANTPVVLQQQGAVAQAPTQQMPSGLPIWPNPRRNCSDPTIGALWDPAAVLRRPFRCNLHRSLPRQRYQWIRRLERRRGRPLTRCHRPCIRCRQLTKKSKLECRRWRVEWNQLHRARAGDVETTAQIQRTLQRTLSASGDLEHARGTGGTNTGSSACSC